MWNFKKKKIKIYNSVNDFLNTTEVPLLTFDELYDLLENQKITDNIDIQIAEKVIAAETDWIITIHSLNDFLVVLEKEIDGKTTKSNLEKLLKKYNSNLQKYSWEAESVSQLLDLFDFRDGSDLRNIFFSLTERIKEK